MFIDWGPCSTLEEAQNFLESKSFDWDSDFDEGLIMEDTENKSPIVHKKGDGSYLVAAENGDGYVAYNKDDVCMGNISASSENEAKTKFNSNSFDE